jgi:hypothetical protein
MYRKCSPPASKGWNSLKPKALNELYYVVEILSC